MRKENTALRKDRAADRWRLQQGYFKSAYEGFVAQATKIGGLYADLAKKTYKPLEGFVAKNTPAK